MDASGLHAFEVAIAKLERDGIKVLLTAVQSQPMKVMFESGLAERIGLDRFWADIDQALAAVTKRIKHEPAFAEREQSSSFCRVQAALFPETACREIEDPDLIFSTHRENRLLRPGSKGVRTVERDHRTWDLSGN
jgi:hypothetical protein